MRRKDGVPMATVLQKLKKLYHPPKSFLHFRTPLDLLVATVLSARCTDNQVNKVTETIVFPKYKTAQDYVKVKRATLEKDVHSCGTYRTKAKHIQELCHILLQRYGGKVPDSTEELIKLPGVGRKTAACILNAVYDKHEGIAVDTHVLRLSQRLGLTNHKDAKKIELDLMEQTPKRDWGRLNPLMISHGRAVCTALHRKCGACVFKNACPSSLVLGKKDLAKR